MTAILLMVYIGIIISFESLLAYNQPASQGAMVITTEDDEGNYHDQIVARLENDGQLYAAANHWPRAWYRRALANPDVVVALAEGTGPYLAEPVVEDEHRLVNSENRLGLLFRILTGFPPRYFIRLDPQ